MTMSVVKTLLNAARKSRMLDGTWRSMVSISLENRLRMRPRGVVSKKDIGARSMEWSNWPWRVLEAFRQARATIMA